MGFTGNKGFKTEEIEKLRGNQYLLRELNGKPLDLKKFGRTRIILVNCIECSRLRKIRLVDYLHTDTNLCKSCIKKGERNTAKLDYVKKKIKESGKDLSYLIPEFRYNFSQKRKGSGNPMFGRKRTERAKKLTSIKHKNNFLDKNFCLEFGRRFNKRPNKIEKYLNEILIRLYGTKYSYIGDFKEFIGGKNPDFISKEDKKIIELFGDYWHSKEHTGVDEQEACSIRINHFNKYGYKTLIIWENEMKNLSMIFEKLINFDEGVIKDV